MNSNSEITFTFCFFFFIFSISSCKNSSTDNSTQSKLANIKPGMSYLDVVEIAGIPDQKINVGVTTDEYGLQTKTEEWHYGDNQLIVIVNDTVSSIDLDLKSTYQRIQHIIDSARAAGDSARMIQQLQ
ncbi:MAG: hypothetical protein IPO83_12645 [Chitinophagaceae bacterium]|nr:hypothetical protein [Chitinophagaceae bacterium]